MRRFQLASAWVVVLVIATALAWQIVSAADAQVSDRPLPLNVSAPVLQSTTTIESTSTPTEPTSSTTSSSQPSTSTTEPTSTQPTTSQTTPTTAPESWQTRVIPTAGGTLVVAYRPGEVYYQTATPNTGYHAEVEKAGPPKVEVKFDSEKQEIGIHVEWKNGDLSVEVSGPEHD